LGSVGHQRPGDLIYVAKKSIDKIMDEPIRKMVTKRIIGTIAGTSVRIAVQRVLGFDIGFSVIIKGGKVIGSMTDMKIKKAIAQAENRFGKTILLSSVDMVWDEVLSLYRERGEVEINSTSSRTNLAFSLQECGA